MVITFLKIIGQNTLALFRVIGEVSIFAINCFYFLFRSPINPKEIQKQLIHIGYLSLPVVGLTTLFSGMVLAIQSYTGFARFNAEETVATIVVLSITRELGPVLAGLMIAGRVGASIAAEIGTMKVTEQIDALKIMSIKPIHFLAVPRIISGIICTPILVLIGNTIGVMGGWLIAVTQLDFNSKIYLQSSIEYLQFVDIVQGLVKASVFGFIVTLIGCYQGFKCGEGAQGVGKAATSAVVTSSILILISNYLITLMFFGN